MIRISQLETDRLLIRPLKLNDAAFMFNLVNTAGWIKNIGNKNVNDITDAHNYIQLILDKPDCDYYVFEHKITQQPMGLSTLIKRANQSYYDIGFAILPEFEKNGFSYEACKALLQIVEDTQQVEKIIGIALRDNMPSIALLNKLGLCFSYDTVENNEELAIYEKPFKQ